MSKKIILVFLAMMILTGCSLKKNLKPKKEMIQDKQIQDYVEPYVDDNPIFLGMYINNKGMRNLVSSYDSELTQYKDIVSLEVYYTKDELLTGNQKELWNYYYQSYEGVENKKIGYYIYFEVMEEKFERMILKPSDGDSIFDYIQIYLYDDINQDGGYYDHITDSEVREDSIFSSIKLTASTRISEITSSIKVKVFTYDEDDFDEDGLYRGNSYYEVIINRV